MKKNFLALVLVGSTLLINTNKVKAEEKNNLKRYSIEMGGGVYVFIPFYQVKMIYQTPVLDNKLMVNANFANIGLPLSNYSIGGRYYFNPKDSFRGYTSLNLRMMDNCMTDHCVGKNGFIFGPNIGIGTDIMFNENVGVNLEVALSYYLQSLSLQGLPMPELGSSLKLVF